jgi:citrate synthase
VDYGTALLAALSGFCGSEHIGVISRSRRLLEASRAGVDIDDLIAEMQSDHEPFACFHHRLYPDGDPRAVLLLERCPVVPEAQRIIEGVQRQIGLQPNIGFALMVAELGYGFPSGSAEALFTIGRAAGWIAHAAEQRASGIWIRPRAAPVNVPT